MRQQAFHRRRETLTCRHPGAPPDAESSGAPSTVPPSPSEEQARRLPTAPEPIPPGNSVPNVPPELAHNPQYEILSELSRGGMGTVYLARNRIMDRLEVLKV